jgi:divalent metal cation (Fe/Co/Zn/Cd) transporter
VLGFRSVATVAFFLTEVRCNGCGHTVEVQFHAEIDGEYSLAAAHDIETELHEQVLDIDFVSDVHVHLDPKGVDEWKDAIDDRSDGATATPNG